jgi:hypothetical protein
MIFLNFLLDVSGKVAGPFCPFDRGLTIGLAIGAYFVSDHSVTPFAGFHDGITSPTVIGTACLLHENTFCSYFYGLTNHGDLPPFSLNLIFSKYLKSLGFIYFTNKHKKKSYQLSVTRFGLQPNEI